MTANKEDYLKVIYEEGGLETIVPNKALSDKLGIAPASVSEMLAKLSREGFVHYEPYKGSRLTEAGLEACMEVVRCHRLWEVFLMRHLGYSWREAHEEAHILEHATPVRMVDRLDTFLNYPKTCPHGSVIPHPGHIPSDNYPVSLSQLKSGDTAQIRKINEDSSLLDYLEGTGLEIGSEIQVLSVEDYEGPITFLQKGKPITISYKASTQIFVQQ